MVLFTVLGKLSIKNASHLKKTPEFMNSFGAVIMMLFISSHTYIKLQFYSMHKMIKSGGMTNPFALYTATIMKCKEEASTWFDQMFWDTWTDITFFDLIFCKNTVSSILNPWSGVMFLLMMWFFAFHRNIRSPSSVVSSRNLFTIHEVLRKSLGCISTHQQPKKNIYHLQQFGVG